MAICGSSVDIWRSDFRRGLGGRHWRKCVATRSRNASSVHRPASRRDTALTTTTTLPVGQAEGGRACGEGRCTARSRSRGPPPPWVGWMRINKYARGNFFRLVLSWSHLPPSDCLFSFFSFFSFILSFFLLLTGSVSKCAPLSHRPGIEGDKFV